MATTISSNSNQGPVRIRQIITLLALLSLGAAYAWGFFTKDNASLQGLEAAFPDHYLERTDATQGVYRVTEKATGNGQGDIILSTVRGWGGPLTTATWVGPDQAVQKVVILHHKETPSFFRHLEESGYFEQFAGKRISDKFELHGDVDAISGATISSAAVAKAVRRGAHGVANGRYGYGIEAVSPEWSITWDEIILLLLYAVVLISLMTRFRRARIFVLGFSVLFLGLHMNRPISLSNLAAILLGYLPSLHEQLFWWLLVTGVPVLTLIMGKNFYCFWMCPFGGIQEFATKIGGVRMALSKRVIRILNPMVYLLVWLALMIVFLTRNPALGMYEPFAVLFSLKGSGIQWYLVSAAVVGSFFIPRFWCRFFCPVGFCLNRTAKIKSTIRKTYAVTAKASKPDRKKAGCVHA